MKIFIIASKHNYRHIGEIKKRLKEMGHQITLPNSFRNPMLEEQVKKISREEHIKTKQKYLKLQVKKVQKNDAVLVVNEKKGEVANYIGGSTFLEMYKAFELKKKIFLINPIPEGILHDEITAFDPIVIHGDLSKISHKVKA